MIEHQVLGIIPARFSSSRFPGKPLVSILGTPLVIHVARKAEEALGRENVCIATEDDRIRKVVEDYGYRAIMTSRTALTGTDRLWEVAQHQKADIYINIQGDEPMVNPADIVKIMMAKKLFPREVINGYCKIETNENPDSINIPKVLVGCQEELIYMSRRAVPGSKGDHYPSEYLKQVCIYAFNIDELKLFGTHHGKTPLEKCEDIEILRFIELGYPVRMVRTLGASLAVDVPEDIQKVEEALSRNV